MVIATDISQKLMEEKQLAQAIWILGEIAVKVLNSILQLKRNESGYWATSVLFHNWPQILDSVI